MLQRRNNATSLKAEAAFGKKRSGSVESTPLRCPIFDSFVLFFFFFPTFWLGFDRLAFNSSFFILT